MPCALPCPDKSGDGADFQAEEGGGMLGKRQTAAVDFFYRAVRQRRDASALRVDRGRDPIFRLGCPLRKHHGIIRAGPPDKGNTAVGNGHLPSPHRQP